MENLKTPTVSSSVRSWDHQRRLRCRRDSAEGRAKARRIDCEAYPVYGPKVIAGISTVTDTIRDRSLRSRWFGSSKGADRARLNIRTGGKAFDALRASMALWASENAEAVEEIYGNMTDEAALEGCDDRFRDIIEPLPRY